MSIATIIAFCIRYRRILMYAAGAIAVLLALWWAVSGLVNHGRMLERAEWQARQRDAEAKAQADSWALVGDINQIDTSVQAGKTATTRLEVKYRDRIVRTAVPFYRDNPHCRAPDGLWRANDEYADQLGAVAKLPVGTLRGPDEAGRR